MTRLDELRAREQALLMMKDMPVWEELRGELVEEASELHERAGITLVDQDMRSSLARANALKWVSDWPDKQLRECWEEIDRITSERAGSALT